jgi:MFS family permease
MRPIGGLFFGYLGDRYGRKSALVTTLLIVGVATFVIGLMPTYASIGIAAPLSLLFIRLLPGFCIDLLPHGRLYPGRAGRRAGARP